MSDALDAAKKIAAGGGDDTPEPPCSQAEFRERRPCRGHLWMCTDPESNHHGLAVRGDHCRQECDHRQPPGNVQRARRALDDGAVSDLPEAARLPTLSMIFTVYDEDRDEVRETLSSAAAAYPHEKLELVVVDDGADPVKSAVDAAETGDAEITYLRHDQNRGVGLSRNAGFQEADGKVISFHDAHMRFPLYDELMETAEKAGHELGIPTGWSSLVMLAYKAITRTCIISSASRDVRPDRGFYASGADLFWNRRDGLQPKWRMPGDWEAQWQRVPCMMGAGYFISRKTAKTLSLTGQLWEDTAGLWGFSEQALSVKAYLLGIPVYASRDIYTRHLYRGSNPVDGAGREVWQNVCRCTSRLFPPDVFEARFLPHCEKRLGEDVADYRAEPAGLADREQCRQVFTDLVGKGAPVSDRHPDHDWLDRLLRVVADLPERPSVLMWRPGEAALQVKRWRPEADITVIVRPGPRANNWWDICRANKIDIVKARLTHDYVKRASKLDKAPFDLVLINGPLQDECPKEGKRVLADGGKIVCNDRADRLQLKDDQRRKEKQNIEAALNKRSRAATGSAQRQTTGPSAVTRPDGGWPHKHSFVPVLRDVLRELQPDRILEWGPGLSTRLCHEECPDATIVTTENQEARAKRARGEHPYARVRHEDLPDYGPSDYAVWPYTETAGPFDLAIVDGRRRNECLLTARKVVAEDGYVILHDSERINYGLGMEFFTRVKERDNTVFLAPRGRS